MITINCRVYIFSSGHGMFKIDHMLDHRPSFSRFQKTEILQKIKLELNNKPSRKIPNIWKLKNTLQITQVSKNKPEKLENILN